MDFPVWTARMRTPADNIKAIRALQNAMRIEQEMRSSVGGIALVTAGIGRLERVRE